MAVPVVVALVVVVVVVEIVAAVVVTVAPAAQVIVMQNGDCVRPAAVGSEQRIRTTLPLADSWSGHSWIDALA